MALAGTRISRMLDRAYRQRLESDLARWEADGVIAPAVGATVRMALPPLAPSINIPVVLGIVGGLLIAAAFLAFVAAHWMEFARVVRVAILFSGAVVAFGVGGWFARDGRSVLADLSAGVGSIVFGAGIAQVGQMYHLGDDFAGGMLLWAVGALAAARSPARVARSRWRWWPPAYGAARVSLNCATSRTFPSSPSG
jgi:uncharacterized membrane protein